MERIVFHPMEKNVFPFLKSVWEKNQETMDSLLLLTTILAFCTQFTKKEQKNSTEQAEM